LSYSDYERLSFVRFMYLVSPTAEVHVNRLLDFFLKLTC